MPFDRYEYQEANFPRLHVRISPDVKKEFERTVTEMGETKKAVLETALRNFFEERSRRREDAQLVEEVRDPEPVGLDV